MNICGIKSQDASEIVESRTIRIDDREKRQIRARMEYTRRIRREREDARRKNYWR